MTQTKTIAMILLIAIATIGAIGIGIAAVQIPSAFAACTGNPHDFGSGPTGNPHDPGDTGNPHDSGGFGGHGGGEGDNCNGAK
jgi:hypothetical protein